MLEPDGERSPQARQGSLDGVCVMVTRPHESAQGLVQLIEQEGGRALRFPALEFAELENSRELALLGERLDSYDLAIFVSPRAVARGLALIRQRREWPAMLPSAAIGEGTAQALHDRGLEVAFSAPSPFSSEALLELAALQAEQVRARRIVIVRGEGGSALLGNTLRARGAEVDYAEVYRRVRPNFDAAPVLASGEVDVIVVTSGEALRNLFEMAGPHGRARLCQTPLVVMSARLAELARELGARAVAAVAPRASDQGLLEALRAWRGGCDAGGASRASSIPKA
jgi:uroporphyrinogen-III synthase